MTTKFAFTPPLARPHSEQTGRFCHLRLGREFEIAPSGGLAYMFPGNCHPNPEQ